MPEPLFPTDFFHDDFSGSPTLQDMQIQAGYLLENENPKELNKALINFIFNLKFRIDELENRINELEN